VNQAFSAIKVILDEKKTLLVLEGALLNINEALKEVLINTEEDSGPCEGKITISDGLNPVQTFKFEEMTDHIKKNQYPMVNSVFIADRNYSVQKQVEETPIIAGEHFSIDFHKDTFIDLNGRPLKYSLEMPGEHIEVPSWLSLRELSLMGTPPEDFWPYKKNICIKASNEYKSVTVEITLNVRLSYFTVVKRVLYFLGYVFTSYKFWQHSDKIYNVLCKKRYRHVKVFKVRCSGKEIALIMDPIILINDEIRRISRALIMSLAKEESYLLNQNNDGSLNKGKLIEKIIQYSSYHNKYQGLKSFNKDLVHQLILNEMTLRRIGNEKKTLEIFEEIKSKWVDLVEYCGNEGFIIRSKNLASELQARNINVSLVNNNSEYSWENKVEDSESLVSSPTKRSIEKELILSPNIIGDIPKINIGLLKDAIIAYAFENQSVSGSRYEISIQSKEVLDVASSLRRFLKLDLLNLVLNSPKQLGYGVKYRFDGNKLVFYGKPEEELENKILVVQIVTRRGWILKEVEIQGVQGGNGNLNLNNDTTIESINAEL